VSLGSAALSGAACSRRQPSKLEPLRVGAVQRLSMCPLHLANEEGYFRDAGFSLDIINTGSPLNSMGLLVGRKLDAYLGSIDSVFLNSVIKGQRVRIVAGREIASPTCGNVAAIYGLRRNFPQGLKDAAPLKGKRIVSSGGIGWAEYALETHLAAAGLTERDVTLVRLRLGEAMAALIGGGVDAMIGRDDLDRDPRTLSGEIIHTPGLSRHHPNFQYSYLYFGETMLAGDVDRGARFVHAYLRGAMEFAQGKTPRYMVEFAKSGNLDLQETVSACRGTYAVDGAISLDSLRLLADWAFRRKYISRPIVPSELVDDRFLKRANEI
jgi:hypothetical protein